MGTATTIDNRYTYTGREKNPVSGTMCYRWRSQYSPKIGLFTNRNPWGYIQGRFGLYDYVRNRPYRYSEPYSTALEIIIGGAILLMLSGCDDDGDETTAEEVGERVGAAAVAAATIRVRGGIDREDDKWNDPRRLEGNNCYEYAMNDLGDVDQPDRTHFKNPGDYSGNSITSMDQVNCTELIRLAKLDGAKEKVGDCCPDNYHEVYLVAHERVDYHWYRKDSNGMWSHKPGETRVTDKDVNGAPIKDPATAAKDYSSVGGPNYKNCGYLCLPD